MVCKIDKAKALEALNNSLDRCTKAPVRNCMISKTIDLVLSGHNCLTYRYIMITALLAKSIDSGIDVLSLQSGDESDGAYDARSVASVVYSFQKEFLGNVIDGSNTDPLVNKPGRYNRLTKQNKVQGGDPAAALNALCDDLPKVATSQEAEKCLDYVISAILKMKSQIKQEEHNFYSVVGGLRLTDVRDFLDNLVARSFGGASLVIAADLLFRTIYNGGNFKIKPHPVNQSGTSSRQFSDLDVIRDGKPYMGVELKDKPFTEHDVEHAAELSIKAGASSLLFVAGRQSDFASQPPAYFNEARENYGRKGLYVGVTSIDALIDIVFSTHTVINPEEAMERIKSCSEEIGAPEAQMWIYKSIRELSESD